MICSECGGDFPEEKFPWDKRRKPHKRRTQCYYCAAQSNKRSRQKNQWKYNLKSRERRNARKQRAVEYKGGICKHCNQTFHFSAFDFNHIDPTQKDKDPGLMMGSTDEKLFEELDKCILLCSNCHRTHHFQNGY